MRAANLSKHLYGLFIFIFAICLFPVFPLVAEGGTLADLSGTWNGYGFATGPSAPWWEQFTLAVATDGTFTLSGTESNGADDIGFSGAFSISSKGIGLTVNGKTNNILCQINLYNSVLSCTETSDDGSTKLTVLTKQATSYSQADLAGSWEANMLDGGPTDPSWVRISGETIDSNGIFQGSYSDSNGSTTNLSGKVAISTNGEVTCFSGVCPDPNWISFMDASKSVIVGTYGVSDTTPDAVFTVLTKMAPSGSYSMDDLAGIWQMNTVCSGPDAPWWERGTINVNPDGSFTFSGTESSSSKTDKGSGTFSISSDGIITSSSLSSTFRAVMDAGKTVMVFTSTFHDGSGSTQIAIATKSAAAGPVVPGAPTIGTAIAGNAQATVSFTPPASDGGSAITGYTVTSNPGGKTARGAGSPIIVKGLTNGTPYTFTVTAKNKMGIGPASSPSSPPVTPATVPSAPAGIKATASNQQVTVSFTAPASNGGSAITGYTVIWTPKDGSDTNAGSPLATTHTVTGLTYGTTYTFTVTATNAMGTGPASKSIKITPATVPSAPTIGTVTAGKKQVSVSFTPTSTGGDPITSYIVTPYIGSNAGKTTSGAHSPITVKGLTSGTAYTFTVTAKNKLGTGTPSTASSSVVPQ